MTEDRETEKIVRVDIKNSKMLLPAVIVAIVSMGLLDFFNGFRLSLYPLYLLPLAYVAWNRRLSTALGVALVAGACIAAKYFVFEPRVAQGYYRVWDGSIKIVLLMVISFGVFRIAQLMRQQEETNRDLLHARSEIQELREMIPICAWCHAVRNDQGFYERIEVYLGQLTGANFTHGICPNCKEKYYGSLTHAGTSKTAESSSQDDLKKQA